MGGILKTELGGKPSLIALVIGVAVLIAGCQEAAYERTFAEGEIDYFDELYTVTAVDRDHVWVAGYFGSIYRSRDGGETWQRIPSGDQKLPSGTSGLIYQKSIYDISFADEQNGWAVGRRGWIVHTTDGGDSWEAQRTPRQPARHIFGIHAIDAKRAFAVGEWGGRYYTDDGGETWQDRSFLVTEDHAVFQYLTEFELERFNRGEKIYDDLYLNDVVFTDDQRGWIVGEYGLTYWTEDGGETWTPGKIRGELVLEEVEFAEGDSEIARSLWPRLFADAESLARLGYLRVRIEGFLTKAELEAANGETFLADERAEAVRGFFEGEGIGQERIRLDRLTPFDEESVDMQAFARSKLSPLRIAKLQVVETPFLYDIKMGDAQNGLIAGLGGVILRTRDGGRTWTYSDTGSPQAFFSVGIGSGGVVAVGEKGLVRISDDGGSSFRAARDDEVPPSFSYMRDMVFADSERGWIVGARGRILRTSDGGRSWTQVLPPAGDGVEADAPESD